MSTTQAAPTQAGQPRENPAMRVGIESFVPTPPKSLEEAGVPPSLIEQLILKNLYFRGEASGRDLARILGLQYSVIEGVVEFLKTNRLIEAKRSSGFGSISTSFACSDGGRVRAKEYLEDNRFLGPAPVPLRDYSFAVRRQRVMPGWMSVEMLRDAFAGAVVPTKFYSMFGPAVNSFKTLLIYGAPGNGKTFLAEQLTNIQTEPIFVPYVIQAEGQYIKVYDSLYHDKLQEEDESVLLQAEEKFDRRWTRCRRPFLTTGGELTMGMLDLMYIPSAKIYDAPYQLKANNGIYLIDDFGRQQISPAELLNRWIYPLDRGRDFLQFNTGSKVEVPFECFLIFSSNLNPNDLGDEAFLRRLEYKMYMPNPDNQEYATIFHNYCKKLKIDCPMGLLGQVIEKHYARTGRKFRRCHPRDVLNVAVDLIRFEKLPYVLNGDILDRAFELKFVPLEPLEE